MISRRDALKQSSAAFVVSTDAGPIWLRNGRKQSVPSNTGLAEISDQDSRMSVASPPESAISAAITETGGNSGKGPSLDKAIVVKWRVKELGLAYFPPTVVDGRVYVGCQSGLHVLEVTSGQRVWSYVAYGGTGSRPAIGNGMVFYSDMNRAGGGLFALDVQTGEVVWQFTPTFAGISSVAVSDAVVCLSANQGTYAFESSTGAEIWNSPDSGNWNSTPVIIADTVYNSSYLGTVHAIDLTTGQERWRITEGELASSPIADNETLYVCIEKRTLVAIDIASGEVRWRFMAEGDIHTLPTVAGSMVLIDADSEFFALDTATGEIRWRYTSGTDRIYRSQVVTDEVVYLAGDHLYALDTGSGQEYWRYAVDSFVVGHEMTVADGVIFIGNHDVDLEAIGNVSPALLNSNVVLRGTPSESGVERGTAERGDEIERLGRQDDGSGQAWVEVTINGTSGWIPLEAIDPSTLPSESDTEYVYIP